MCLLKDADCCGQVKRHFKCLSAALSFNRHKRCPVKVFIGLEVEEWEMRWETRYDCELLLADTSALSLNYFSNVQHGCSSDCTIEISFIISDVKC